MGETIENPIPETNRCRERHTHDHGCGATTETGRPTAIGIINATKDQLKATPQFKYQ